MMETQAMDLFESARKRQEEESETDAAIERSAEGAGDWQHHVDYSPFKKNKLRPRSDLEVPDGPDEYGMVLQDKEGHVTGLGDFCECGVTVRNPAALLTLRNGGDDDEE